MGQAVHRAAEGLVWLGLPVEPHELGVEQDLREPERDTGPVASVLRSGFEDKNPIRRDPRRVVPRRSRLRSRRRRSRSRSPAECWPWQYPFSGCDGRESTVAYSPAIAIVVDFRVPTKRAKLGNGSPSVVRRYA